MKSKNKNLRSHLIQEIAANHDAEIRVDTCIKNGCYDRTIRTDIFVCSKKHKMNTLIEVGITYLDLLTQVENKKLRKYNLIANESVIIYKCKVRIISYVMIWDRIVTKCQKKYIKDIGIQLFMVLLQTLESLFLNRRQGFEEEKQ